MATAPWTCCSKATKSRKLAGSSGGSSRTSESDTTVSSSPGTARAVATASRSVPTGNNRTDSVPAYSFATTSAGVSPTIGASAGSRATTPTRTWGSTPRRSSSSTRTYLIDGGRSDVKDGREDPLPVGEDRDGLTEGELLEVRVAAVRLEGVLVVVDLEDLEDRRLLGVLVDDVGLAARFVARGGGELDKGVADDVLLAGLRGPGGGADEGHRIPLSVGGADLLGVRIRRGRRGWPWSWP